MQLLQPNRQQAEKPAVLVVDDEPAIRELLSRWLDDAGFTPVTASGVDQAKTLLTDRTFTAITCDVKMSGMTGAQWLPELRRTDASVPILMLTGCNDTRLAVELLKGGANTYLLKPLQKAAFLGELRGVIQESEEQQRSVNYLRSLEQQVADISRLLHISQEETTDRLIATSLLHHDETGEHVRRIGKLSEIVASRLGWQPAEAKQLRLAAAMHDIGKVGIPDSILRKPGKLTSDEFEVMKTHTTLGERILSGSSSFSWIGMARDVALCHHERWDGTGYPHGLRGSEIPMAARIVAIVDVFDALIHDRVYRSAFSLSVTLHMLEEGIGKHFDPDVATCFFETLPLIQATLHRESKSIDASAQQIVTTSRVKSEGLPRLSTPVLNVLQLTETGHWGSVLSTLPALPIVTNHRL